MHTEPQHKETRHVVIYGYTLQELAKVMKHFESQLPEYVKITIDNDNLVTRVTLTGVNSGVELLRFRMNKYQQNLHSLFSEETVSLDERTPAQVLGDLLQERELSVSCAESCTGGNLAHRIVQVAGPSAYFLGSVVSYSNDVKAEPKRLFPGKRRQLCQRCQGRRARRLARRHLAIWRRQPSGGLGDGRRSGQADAHRLRHRHLGNSRSRRWLEIQARRDRVVCR